jgi:hypothetical protein
LQCKRLRQHCQTGARVTDNPDAIKQLTDAVASRAQRRFALALDAFARKRGIDTSTGIGFLQALYCAAKEHPELSSKRGRGRPRKIGVSAADLSFVREYEKTSAYVKMRRPGEYVPDTFKAKVLIHDMESKQVYPPSQRTVQNKISRARRKGLITK